MLKLQLKVLKFDLEKKDSLKKQKKKNNDSLPSALHILKFITFTTVTRKKKKKKIFRSFHCCFFFLLFPTNNMLTTCRLCIVPVQLDLQKPQLEMKVVLAFYM